MRSGEFDIIARYFAPLAMDGAFGLRDDAAILDVAGQDRLVITQDSILEGIHFLASDPLASVAFKALAVNISDCTAKGATPFVYSISLGLPDRFEDKDIAALAEGLRAAQALFGAQLSGGDTYRSPERLAIGVTLIGKLVEGKYVSRLGARPGDIIAVTNTIGNAALGLLAATGEFETQLDAETKALLLEAYRQPRPPFELAAVIAKFANASMDVSDGLLGDCEKLLAASGATGTITREQVPVHPLVTPLLEHNNKHWDAILSGGDDYQLLFTVTEKDWSACCKAVEEASLAAGLREPHRVTAIGKVHGDTKPGEEGQSLFLTIEGVPQLVTKKSFSHF
ncbi:MAG: thiamine-phosphate kinase [Pseudomonadota bacterium]